ncbi:hypothetical protein [Gloeocapsopsis dulcis]|uniref:CopG family transcriptional regulator n=1 Tax=Gloeocapsopsis dulcis AAB1 = 1H9 TaxID=1433147 RepID=A0A6N8G4A3_9CHRO|nr:hypothetical protein [Gloeocapsopsis dulcis]MUL39195.1 hypothetical protein [Gloeocapsopsis dulcis AAB1 = 1H9]WNN90763.1 hypothetical protein P0S91_06715 [Gloeocapsopsis dulcis]
MARKGGNPETYFKSNYGGKVAKKAVGVKLPLELDAYVRSLESPSDWLREAAIEKYQREQLHREQAS